MGINLRVMSGKIRALLESEFGPFGRLVAIRGLGPDTAEAIWKDECNLMAQAST